jgi:hypothetical protein
MLKQISIALVGIFTKIYSSQFIIILVYLSGKEHYPYQKSYIHQINCQNQFILLEKTLSGNKS